MRRWIDAVAARVREVMQAGRASRTVMAGWGKLAGTNAAYGLLQLIGFTIAAQSLELAALSIIVLIQTYVRVVDGLFNFQSVNVLTRYLAEAQHHDDREDMRGLVKAGLLVDGFTALVATVIAVAALPAIAPIVGIPSDWLAPAILFCFVIPTRILGVSEALLRCFDRFWSIGLRGTLQGIILVAASLAAWWSGAGAQTFLYIWLAAEAAANMAFVLWALIVARSQGIGALRGSSARRAIKARAQFWPMLWQTNLIFAIRMLSQEADVLVAGSVLGPAAAGLLRAAKNLAGVVNQLGRPLQQAASAAIARLIAARRYDEMLHLIRGIGLAAGSVSLVLVLAAALLGEHLLSAMYGEAFASVKWPLVALLATASLYMFGVPLLPLAIALDRPRIAFDATVLGTVMFFALLATLTNPLGILGITLAHVGFNATWLFASWMLSRRAIASARSESGGGPATGSDLGLS